MSRQFFTLANQLTLLRLIVVPFFVLAILGGQYRWALALLLVAGVSDALDGVLARTLKQRTPLGAYLDPIADKLLLSTAFLILAVEGKVPWPLTILVLGRDVLIVVVAGVIVIAAGWRPFPPSLYGKATTVVQVLTVFAVVLDNVWTFAAVAWARDVLLWLTAALVVVSGAHYALHTGKMLPHIPPPE